MFHMIEEAIEDLKAGKIIIVCDDEDRENEGDFLAAAEYATPETINFMAKEGRGLICTPITEKLADKLALSPMTAENTDKHDTAFTVSIDHLETTTGISAFERLFTIQEMLKMDAEPAQFTRPGHVFPLIAKHGGVLERAGHTEAAVDLAGLAGALPAGVICEIMTEDGRMARVPDLKLLAERFGLKMITVQQLKEYRSHINNVKREADVNLPTRFGNFRSIVFSSPGEDKEHIAFIKGDVSTGESVLLRVHSECLTGDIFGSLRCDCGNQLHAALEQIEEKGQGVLLYMRQEGRGIGLVNKLKAYEMQEKGYDTVEANHKLGFEADIRDYETATQILKNLGIKQIDLLTNNPRKISGLTKHGLKVRKRIPLQVEANKENTVYLETKRNKLGHLLDPIRSDQKL